MRVGSQIEKAKNYQGILNWKIKEFQKAQRSCKLLGPKAKTSSNNKYSNDRLFHERLQILTKKKKMMISMAILRYIMPLKFELIFTRHYGSKLMN